MISFRTLWIEGLDEESRFRKAGPVRVPKSRIGRSIRWCKLVLAASLRRWSDSLLRRMAEHSQR